MAKFYVRVHEAFDSTSNGLTGTMVKDMFRTLASGSFEAKTAAEAVEMAMNICGDYMNDHPEASVMPSIRVTSGRKPNGFDKMTEASNPAMRKFLKRETETV